MTLSDAIEALVHLRDKAHEAARRYTIELQAHEEVLQGKPLDESGYAHVTDQYIYRQARADAEARKESS